MSRDAFESDVGGELRDRYGRPQYVLSVKHAPPASGDTIRGYQPADGDGRLQFVLLDANGNNITSGVTTSAMGDGVTNNLATFRTEIAAHVNGTILLPEGTFVVDNAAALGAALTFTGSSLTIAGAGEDATIIKLGPENANAPGFGLFGIGTAQTLTLQNLTLLGPTAIGGTGPPTNPGSPAGTSYSQSIVDNALTAGSLVRFINCHVKNFVFNGVSRSSIDAINTWFEGRGTLDRSMGPSVGDDGTTGYSPAKYLRLTNCILSSFGDSAGGVFYHHIYAGTSHDLFVSNTVLYGSPGTAGGPMAQHYDTNVAFANAAKHAAYTNCYFQCGASQSALLTSYNCPTKIIGTTIDNVTAAGILIAGPTIVDNTVINLGAANVDGIVTTVQGQSTGLDWGLQLSNSRIKHQAGVVAHGVQLANSSATSEFTIGGDTVFEGATATGGIYIWMNAITGRVNVGDATFKGVPQNAIRGAGAGTLNIGHGTRFLQTGGIDVFTNGTALALLRAADAEFSGGTPFSLSVAPTVMHSARNFGSQWVDRTAVAASYTMLPYDELIAVTSTSAARTITAVAANSVPAGKEIVIADESGAAATNNITFAPAGADTLKGSGVINTNNGFARWRSNGTNAWTRVG